MINAECSICGNASGYDKETLKGSTYKINGAKIVLCCPCEDEMFHKFLRARLSQKRANQICSSLLSEESQDIKELYRY